MRIEFDVAKNEKNIRERGLSFERVADFEFNGARIEEDLRFAYSEPRYLALGRIGPRVHALVFAFVEDGIRVISFRKANSREVKRYEETDPADR